MRSHQSATSEIVENNQSRRTLEVVPGTQANRRLRGAYRLYNCIDCLEHESRAVLNGTTVIIRALVADILKELVKQITVRT
jgi:hypothetical protein